MPASITGCSGVANTSISLRSRAALFRPGLKRRCIAVKVRERPPEKPAAERFAAPAGGKSAVCPSGPEGSGAGLASNRNMDFNRYIAAAEFETLAAFFRARGEPLRLERGDRFSEQGLRCRYGGLVEEGAFRYVHLSGAGDRHVVGFAFAGEFVGDYVSMRCQTLSQVSIEALRPCRVLRVAAGTLESLYRTDAGHERLGRGVAESLLSEVYGRLLETYAASPQERYEALLRRCPRLMEYCPARDLASWLGIRPETFSRIRGRIR